MATAVASPSVGFLGLPAETRNHIYRLVLPAKATLTIASGGTYAPGMPDDAKTFLNLMRVSRQVRAECGPMLSARLRHEVYCAQHLEIWLDSNQGMGYHVRDWVFHFERPWELRRALHALQPAASSLQSITIVCWAASRRYSRELAESFMPLLRAIQRADMGSTKARSLMNVIRISPRTIDEKLMTKRVAAEFKAELKKLLAEGRL
ncbi:hypothetical protein BDY17DRAFT_173008 [Neohortaea acidophila]|uniref:F-box domain-containing protein n=1 Tax=Neohortaea acidophila TaxID=245834 RepID=A0A6A6PP52_9PEZI|nr:uncharacterized protein BDY17DRAFT_173008 [Neohortaea acidophila]KAF2481868.1 hypothetical protein BDY17DRAFT_173008 [Neohortaea acidophila]